MEEQIIEAGMDIFLPVMESAAVLAAHYTKSCGRDAVLAEDMKMGLMYAARNVTGKQIGSLYPEVYEDEESDEDSESSSWETVSDDDTVWTRYEPKDGEEHDDVAMKMNECADTWDAWEPETPAECAIKNAIEKGK